MKTLSAGTSVLIGAAVLLCACIIAAPASVSGAEKHVFEAEAAGLLGGASKVPDPLASGGTLVQLTNPGQGVRWTGLPAAGKLAIRYASVSVGTISVAVDDQPACKMNVHSSGALTNSFLRSIVEVPRTFLRVRRSPRRSSSPQLRPATIERASLGTLR